jgi:Helix-turn-helix domain
MISDMASRLMLIAEHLQNGLQTEIIARRMGLTKWQVFGALYHHDMSISMFRRGTIAVRSMREVACLFGVNKKTVRRWIHDGYLKPVGQHRKGRLILITDALLVDFIDSRETWPLWEVGRMTDPDWREYAHEQRQKAHGEWVLVRDIIAQQYYDRSTAACMVKRGHFPDAVLIRNAYYVWRSHGKS